MPHARAGGGAHPFLDSHWRLHRYSPFKRFVTEPYPCATDFRPGIRGEGDSAPAEWVRGWVIDSGLVGSTDFWEGFRESRRCSRDTHPESYITEYTQYTKIKGGRHRFFGRGVKPSLCRRREQRRFPHEATQAPSLNVECTELVTCPPEKRAETRPNI